MGWIGGVIVLVLFVASCVCMGFYCKWAKKDIERRLDEFQKEIEQIRNGDKKGND